MRAKTVDQIFEFIRGGSPLEAMGLGRGAELKKKMEADDAWTPDHREQLMWAIIHNEVALVVYLLDGEPKVKPGFYWDYEIKPLMKGRASRSYRMWEPMTDDMHEILTYYVRKGNMIPSRAEYFIKKYKDHGIK